MRIIKPMYGRLHNIPELVNAMQVRNSKSLQILVLHLEDHANNFAPNRDYTATLFLVTLVH